MGQTQFDFVAPPKIVFGWGRRKEIGPLARSLGDRAFLVTGSRTLERAGVFKDLADRLTAAGLSVVTIAAAHREPEVEDVDNATLQIRSHLPRPGDLIVAIGGGAALDLGKALAGMALNLAGDGVRDYLEGVGKGLQLELPPLPILAVPTTAGTGSEATRNAVISSASPPFKKSLRSERLVPRIALIDPELTVSNPPSVTAHSGMDAITQLLESYVSRKAQPIPQALALRGLDGVVPALREAYRNGESREAREKLAMAALFSGMALANSGLGMAHGVASALGCHLGTAHGLACAVMLPIALRVNAPVCLSQFPPLTGPLLGRSISDPQAARDAILEEIDALGRDLAIPHRLSEIGVRKEQIPMLVQSSRGSSMSGNPRDLSDDELATILEEAS
jgi:alcohol dehydrogenase class IV